MARRAPTQPLSPQMLRHFAVATGAIMFVLILFAGGEIGEMREAEAAKRRFALAQAERTAANKVHNAALKLDKTRSFGIIEENPQPFVPIGDEGGSGGDGDRIVAGSGPADIGQAGPAPNLTAPGSQLRAGDFGDNPIPGKPGTAKPRKSAPAKRKPSQEEIDRLTAASRARSGGASVE